MEITLNLEKLKKVKLSCQQAILLYLLYHKNFKEIKEYYTYSEAKALRDVLVNTPFVLSTDKSIGFFETEISRKNVAKLFNLRTEEINFAEFYNIYPIKVGNRVLRARGLDTVQGKKHEKKYLAKIKSVEEHQKACKTTQAYINRQRQSNKLMYLPNIQTVLNNALWESWEVFVEVKGKEGSEWNESII
jgi:hypothetical protein